VQHSLLNDEGLRKYSLLPTTEPYIYRHPATDQPTVTPHRHWQMFGPTVQRQDGAPRHAFRTLIWTHQDCKATAVPADSYDITAITIPLQDEILLAIACYDPRDRGSVYEQERQLSRRMTLVQQTIQRVQDAYPAQTVEVCIGADLNRHHVL